MTCGTLKKRVMQLIFSYSVAGSEIPDTYNNQTDYQAMIPSLVNDFVFSLRESDLYIFKGIFFLRKENPFK